MINIFFFLKKGACGRGAPEKGQKRKKGRKRKTPLTKGGGGNQANFSEKQTPLFFEFGPGQKPPHFFNFLKNSPQTKADPHQKGFPLKKRRSFPKRFFFSGFPLGKKFRRGSEGGQGGKKLL